MASGAPEENEIERRSRKKPSRSARAAIGNLATKLIVFALALVANLVVDRALGPHDRGLFAFLLLVGNFLLPVLTFGFGGAVVYFITSGQREAKDVTVTVLTMGCLMGIASAGITFGLWRLGWLGDTGSQLPWVPLAAILFLAPFQGIRLMAGRVLFGQSRFGTNNWLNLARAGVHPVLLLTLVVVVDLGLWGAVLATIIVTVALTLASVAVLMPERPRLRFDVGFVGEALRYGIKMWVGDLATRVNLRLDQMILGLVAPASALGNYSVAMRLSELLWVFPDAVNPVFFNRLAGADTDEQRMALTGRIHRIGLLGMMVLAVGAGVGGWFVIPWFFGEQFGTAHVIFALLMPGTVIMYTPKVLTKYFAAVARPDLAGRLGLWSGLTGALLYVGLIPLLGSYGGAVATSLSYGFMALFSVRAYRSLVGPTKHSLVGYRGSDLQWLADQLGGRLRRRRSSTD